MIGGFGWTILCLAFICYGFYDKHSETEQIKAISNIKALSYEELSTLIDKIKK